MQYELKVVCPHCRREQYAPSERYTKNKWVKAVSAVCEGCEKQFPITAFSRTTIELEGALIDACRHLRKVRRVLDRALKGGLGPVRTDAVQAMKTIDSFLESQQPKR